MSALARYFHRHSDTVAGYDRTPSALTKELEEEGIEIVYGDDQLEIGDLRLKFLPQDTLVVRTPAVPENNAIYTYFREHGYTLKKRAEVLGMVTREKKALCVAGTHGKTTTSTMIAWLLSQEQRAESQEPGINAFLGGISMNFGTNVLIDKTSEYVVVEADEYDRSFHHLEPYISVVTAVDADHLDIYGTAEAYREAFAHYTSLIKHALVMKHGIELKPRLQPGVKCYTYGVQSTDRSADRTQTELPDFYATNIRIANGEIKFDFVTPTETERDLQLGVPVWVNIENAVAAMTVAYLVGKDLSTLSSRLSTFKGVWRRFNIHVNTPKVIYIDDYAHHPQEIATTIESVRKLYPNRKLIGVFQPHLYTRTRDFAEGFRQVLSTMDECILLPIYPARELPIEGVSSEMLLSAEYQKAVQKSELVSELKQRIQKSTEPVVVLTVGAGDIDRLVDQIAKNIENL